MELISNSLPGFSNSIISIAPSCDSVKAGYHCYPEISQSWGQYSSFFSVPSDVETTLPETCEIVFAQMLSRHGARWPTYFKTYTYNNLVSGIKNNVTSSFKGKYAFLNDYKYEMGDSNLTTFGEQQMINSGIKFFERYQHIAKDYDPFVRTTDSRRVKASALLFSEGFHNARLADNKTRPDASYPYPTIILPEKDSFNNSLHAADHCAPFHKYADDSDRPETWRAIWTAPIIKRLTTDLPGIRLDAWDACNFMDLCPFETANNAAGRISPFCDVFTASEWKDYDYQKAIEKWYGRANGNPLSATVGVGYVNELIARLTNRPVRDHTSTNSTMDADPRTFPIGEENKLFADFTHDNDMLPVLAALGVYIGTAALPGTRRQGAEESGGFSSSWSVPFGARVYFEKMRCAGDGDELVRILINDRVTPLSVCESDEFGRCKLDEFVEGLSFARSGGEWDRCQSSGS